MRFTFDLLPEEAQLLGASERCASCGHLTILHEYGCCQEDRCRVEGCSCATAGLSRAGLEKAERERAWCTPKVESCVSQSPQDAIGPTGPTGVQGVCGPVGVQGAYYGPVADEGQLRALSDLLAHYVACPRMVAEHVLSHMSVVSQNPANPGARRV